MNEFQLQIIAHDRIATMERIFRVMRHRGSTISALNMRAEHNKIQVNVMLLTDRAIATLQKQLEKLIDVESVQVL